MLARRRNFPFLEVLILVVSNILNSILAVINAFCWSLANSSIGGKSELTTDEILIFTFHFGINIFIPFLVYFLVLYHSQNFKFLKFWLILKNNLINKIIMCILLLIISPLSLILFTLFGSYQQSLRDFFLSIPLSMGFPLMLFFIFEPIITKLVNKHCEKHSDSKSWLKKNYDLRMEILAELSNQSN